MDFLYNINVSIPPEYAKYKYLHGEIPRSFQQIYSNWTNDEIFQLLDYWYRQQMLESDKFRINQYSDVVYINKPLPADDGVNSQISKFYGFLNGYEKLQYFDVAHPIYAKGFLQPFNYAWDFKTLSSNGLYVNGKNLTITPAYAKYELYEDRRRYASRMGINFNYMQWCKVTKTHFSLDGEHTTSAAAAAADGDAL